VWTLLAGLLCLVPLAGLARDLSRQLGADADASDRAAFGAALVWCLTPLPWLVGTELYSDPLGLLLGLGMLLLCQRALGDPERARGLLLLAAVAAGLMLGTRLAYASLLLPLPYAWWRSRQRAGLAPVLAFLGTVALWAGWQWAMDGVGLLQAGLAHTRWNLAAEGVAVTADPHPVVRTLTLLRILVVHGLGGFWPGTPGSRIPATLALAGLGFVGLTRLSRAIRAEPLRIIGLWILPYVLGMVLGFAVGFPRYGLPLVACGALVVGVGLPAGRTAALAALLVVALALAAVSVPLAIEHRASPPVPWQLARYLRERVDPSRALVLEPAPDTGMVGLFLFETARGFLVAPEDDPDLRRTMTFFEARGRTVFATVPPSFEPEEWVPLARFCRDRLLDNQSLGELWLFRHDPQAGGVSDVPACEPSRP
jgi:hypothetical protein